MYLYSVLLIRILNCYALCLSRDECFYHNLSKLFRCIDKSQTYNYSDFTYFYLKHSIIKYYLAVVS